MAGLPQAGGEDIKDLIRVGRDREPPPDGALAVTVGSTANGPAAIMQVVKRSGIALLLLLAACSGSDSPILNRVGEGSFTARIGPGGGVIRGAGGSPLEGLEITIQPGALTRLIEFTIDVGEDIDEPGTVPVSRAIQIRTTPDPGVLRIPALTTVAVDVPEFRSFDDLLVVGVWPEGRPSALPIETGPRRLVLSSAGAFDREAKRYTFALSDLVDLQVRLTNDQRLTADAAQLVLDGYSKLANLTSSEVIEADVMFSEAQAADPYYPLGNLLRAVSRVLVAFDDRRNIGPGLDSIGEALVAIGLDVEQESLLSRVRSGRWPRTLRVPPGGPSASEIQALFRERIRPVLEAALRDVDRVPGDTAVLVNLPALLTQLPGDREVDVADALALRASLTGAMFLFDWLEDVELQFDAAGVTAEIPTADTWQEFFALFPAVGLLRNTPDARTITALQEAVFASIGTIDALDGENDPQDDDLLVFRDSFDSDARADLRSNLVAVRESLAGAGVQRLRFGGAVGGIDIDLSAPFQTGALVPRNGLPQFDGVLPLAGTITQPDLGGVLPGMAQDRATDLLRLFTAEHALIEAPIVIDGQFDDWAPATEALLPQDPLSDTRTGLLRAVDLRRVYAANSGDALVFRISIADDSIDYRDLQPTTYAFEIRERRVHGFGNRIDIRVHMEDGGPRVEVLRDGIVRVVTSEVAFNGRDLELSLNRFELLDADEPVVDRVLWTSAEALDLTDATPDGDRTRGVLIRF